MHAMRASPHAADAYWHYSVHRLAMRLPVNRVDRVAYGLCAELLPDRSQLDDWGYPMVGEGERAARAGRRWPRGGARMPDA